MAFKLLGRLRHYETSLNLIVDEGTIIIILALFSHVGAIHHLDQVFSKLINEE